MLIRAPVPSSPPKCCGAQTVLARALACTALAALGSAAPLAHAQDSAAQRLDALETKLNQSLLQIEQLRGEIARLRAATPVANPNAAGAVPAAPQTARVEELERQVAQINDNQAKGLALRPKGLALHGFADVSAGHSRENNRYRSGAKGFAAGNFSLYLTPEFGDRIKSLVELVVEVAPDGETHFEAERLQMGYTFSDAATLWAGRFHTPYGVWNTAFHHGAQIQTSITRPRFLEFEDNGGILPAHTVGLWLAGTQALASARLHYDVYVGNSPRISVNPALAAPGGQLHPNTAGSDNHGLQVGMRAGFALRGGLEGLKLGVHALRATVGDDSAAHNRTRLTAYGPYLSYTDDRWEVLSEFYQFKNRDLSSPTGTHSSHAGYLQAGYALGRLTPYLRAERAVLSSTDNYFALQNSGHSYSNSLVGLRFELNPNVALKLEAGQTHLRNVRLGAGDDRFSNVRTQLSMRF